MKISNGVKIFIDFDDTIFNTKAFKKDYLKVFEKLGISKKELLASYTACKRGKIGLYNLRRHLALLKRTKNIKIGKARKKLNIFMKSLKKYLFRDFFVFVKNFSKKELYLISYGDAHFVNMKISGSGVRGYFKKVIATGSLKAYEIEKLLGKGKNVLAKEKIFFVDDRPEQIEAVKKKFKSIVSIHMRRKEGRYSSEGCAQCDYKARSLREVSGIIKNLSL